MKNIAFLITVCLLAACNTRKTNNKTSIDLSNQEKVDANNIKQFFARRSATNYLNIGGRF